MPKRRQLVVKGAFERLSANFGGSVTLDVIQRVSYRFEYLAEKGSDTGLCHLLVAKGL